MKGEIAVRYTIRHFDLPLLTFEANMDSADTDLHIIKVYEENRSFLPLNLTVSEDGVERWLRHRTIPKNRAYVDALLSKVGLSLNGKPYNDYGIGFYCTQNPNMAKEWGVGIDHNGYANRYKIECDGLTILDLNAPGYTMLHWLTILLENREFDTSAPLAAEAKEYLMNTFHLDYKSADIIIGYRADDSYFSFASDFINGAISYRRLCNAMRLGKLGQQFVLKSKAAFEQLEFLGYETADSKEWYKKKAFRDQTARRQYFDVERNRRQRGDLYITMILDEEMRPNDSRLR